LRRSKEFPCFAFLKIFSPAKTTGINSIFVAIIVKNINSGNPQVGGNFKNRTQ